MEWAGSLKSYAKLYVHMHVTKGRVLGLHLTVLQSSGPKKTKLYGERFLPPNKEKAIQEDSGIRLSWFEISFGHLSARSSWASSYLLCAVIGDDK